MYAPETILALKEPRSTDDKPFAYDRVKVVNVSPIQHPIPAGAQWSGGDATGIIIQPLTSYEANLDEPFGKLRLLYDVESTPDPEVNVQPTVRRYDATTAAGGRTPEEVFEVEAPNENPEDKRRNRDPLVSPLPDPRPKPGEGPLGPVAAPKEDAAA